MSGAPDGENDPFAVSRVYVDGIMHFDPTYYVVIGEYYHTDQVGSTLALTKGNEAIIKQYLYTSFGELVESSGWADTRYQYAGQHGYESGLLADLGGAEDAMQWPFMHVGARWYDPMSGRFLQRDPIGILGGLNVYAYAANMPTSSIDPYGLQAPPNATDNPRYRESDGHSNHVLGGIIVPEPSKTRNQEMGEDLAAVCAGVIDGQVPSVLGLPGLDPAGRLTRTRDDPGYKVAKLGSELIGYAKTAVTKFPMWIKKLDKALRPPNPPPYVSD